MTRPVNIIIEAYLFCRIREVNKYGYCDYCPKCGGTIRSGHWEGWNTNNPRWKRPGCVCGFEVGDSEYCILDALELRFKRLQENMLFLYERARKYPEHVRDQINEQYPNGKSGVNDGYRFDEYDNFEDSLEQALNLYFFLKEIIAYCDENNIQI